MVRAHNLCILMALLSPRWPMRHIDILYLIDL